MSALTASRCSTLLFVGVLVVVSAERKLITAKSGQDVILTCRAPNNNIAAVNWTRLDMQTEYVLLYRDGHFDRFLQNPSFKNRVDLQDRQMKDGDVSLILKDVTINDTGTYQCRVIMEEPRSPKNSYVYLRVDPPVQENITAESGQDVTLTCRAPNNNIFAVEWSRADLGDQNVFVARDGHFVPANQHPSFKNRVDLQDRQMKDGDVSLILKDVTINDTETYKCRVFMEKTLRWQSISIIHLDVVDPGQTGGYLVWMIGLGLVLFLLLLLVLIYKKIQEQRINRRKQVGRSAAFSKLNSESPPAVPRSQSYPTRRKTDDQGQKETDDADLQSPQMNCESDNLKT